MTKYKQACKVSKQWFFQFAFSFTISSLIIKGLYLFTAVDTRTSRNVTWSPERYHGNRAYHFAPKKNGTIADVLASKVKILCLIFTHKENHLRLAVHVNVTWAQRCTKHVFISESPEKTLPMVKVDVLSGRDYLWNKTKESFKWAHRTQLNKFDWFFKADDDTFTIMENMKYTLSFYNSTEPWYFGCHFSPFSERGYMSGGAGYVLSKGSLKLLVEKGLSNGTICPHGESGSEDVNMGICMSNLGVNYGDSRDEFSRWRYFPAEFKLFIIDDKNLLPEWLWDYMYYNVTQGVNCCSDTAVSIHYIDPYTQHFFNYILYYFKVSGRSHYDPGLPASVFI